MRARLARLALLACSMSLVTTLAFAQGAASNTSLAGIVKDADGGVIPGATITVVNVATKVTQTTVTNGQGLYSFPTMDVGSYTVTVEITGFKKVTHTDVRLLGGQPANITTTLEVGGLTEVVTVSTPTDLVRLESPTVSSTISGEFIKSVPRLSRNALDFLVFLPGVSTPGANARGSTISGLPQNTINITIDGVSTSNNLQSGDGFFTMVTPRLDAVEEVTLTTATAGADSSAQGATQVRFVTKSGGNSFRGTACEYFQHESLNTNTFFNGVNGLEKPRATVDTFGGSLGGPIVIPGLYDGRGKAFFFFNEEVSWTPNEVARARRVLRPGMIQGNFSYDIANPKTVNILALAAANGQISRLDPTVAAILNQIDTAAHSTGTIIDSSNQLSFTTFNYFVNVASTRNSPTTRIDYNITPTNRVTGTYYLQRYKDSPDTLNNAESTFPGFPAWAHQNSYRTTGSASLRSTLNSAMVNEVLFGWQSSPNDFFGNSSPDMFTNQDGYFLNLGFPVSPTQSTLTNAAPGNSNNPQPRNTPNFNIDNNLNWLKGNHSFKFGGSFTRISNTITNWTTVPQVNFGFNTTLDPAAGLFNTTNFPGASNNDLNNARSMYAMLTGRIASLPGTGRLNEEGTEYIYNGRLTQAERMDEWGFYVSDSWRVKPNTTLSLGLRYELQKPMVPTKSTRTTATIDDLCGPSGYRDGAPGIGCNVNNPGVFNNPGQVPTFLAYTPGSAGYSVDKNNFAPVVGITYRPNVQGGIWRTIMGDPEQAVISAGFTRAFNRERIDRFTGVYGGNPGATVTAQRNTAANGYPLIPPGATFPLLFTQKDLLGPPDFQKTPIYPITATTQNDIRVFDPAIQTPYTDSWTIGFQRALSKDTAFEIRYIGNRNQKPWDDGLNYNAANWVENGLVDEFKLAQGNLLANVAAGRGGSFAYFGPGTGTAPLPIFLAHFTGSTNFNNPANYTTAAFANAAQFTNNTWIGDLDPVFADPTSVAGNLYSGNSAVWRNNGIAAGYAQNFWVMNPLVDEASVQTNIGGSRYNSLQFDLRRRYSKGFQIQGSYTYARGNELTNLEDLHFADRWRRQTQIPHKLAMLWVWDLPVGRGKRFASDANKWLDGVIGGWTFAGGGRLQIPIFRLANTRLVGMTHDDVQSMFKDIRYDVDPATGLQTVWNMPLDVIEQTRLAYSTDPTHPSGYAGGNAPTGRYFAPAASLECIAYNFNDCAPDDFYYGNWFTEFDFKFVKKFNITQRVTFDLNVEVFNAFKAKNFNQNMNPGDGANIFRITGTASGARRGQLVFRVNF